MLGFAVTIVVGIVCILLGISNMKGNISSLHSYHRHRVNEEDVRPFGKAVGLGTIIIGIGVSVYGGVGAIALISGTDLLLWIGDAAMLVGFAVGIPLCICAIIKYNKGLF